LLCVLQLHKFRYNFRKLNSQIIEAVLGGKKMDELPILDTLQMYVIFGTRNFLVYALLEKKNIRRFTHLTYLMYFL